MGSVGDRHQPPPRSSPRVPGWHRARNLRARDRSPIGMALLKSPRLRAGIVAIAVCLGGGANLRAQTVAVPIEANVKAVFLFNFAKYVTWPPVNLGDRSPAEVRVCVTAN